MSLLITVSNNLAGYFHPLSPVNSRFERFGVVGRLPSNMARNYSCRVCNLNAPWMHLTETLRFSSHDRAFLWVD